MKKGCRVLCQGAQVKYAFIKSQKFNHKITRMCEIFEVSTSGYYDWLERPESSRAMKNRSLKTKIEVFHNISRNIYGSPRIHRDLVESGEIVGVNRVARIMRLNGIQSKMSKKFIVTTNSKSTTKPAPDYLKRNFSTEKINEAWVSDTTFITTHQGWLFLAVILDLFSRQIIGWSMGNKNNTQLVEDALTMAIWRRGKVKDVIVHSEQGSTYASGSYQRLLKAHQLAAKGSVLIMQ